MTTLIQDVRSEQNIFSAWRHVKRSALASQNDEIRGAASEFEHAHQRHLRRIIAQLRDGRFVFAPAKGVLKDAKKRVAAGKMPRPIAIAPIENRIVQRAVLQVLQPRKVLDARDQNSKFAPIYDPRLNKINEINRSHFGVGGLMRPYGGVFPAVTRIREAIDSGARHFYQSDIKEFFTKIPTAGVVDFVRSETGDDALADLFSRGLEVHLANKDELKGYADLFPQGGIGVAQGSSLSAFAGNSLLYDLDHELNDMGVVAIRYIDDILIVSNNEAALNAAVDHAEKTLTLFGFGLYEPNKGSYKAARGECGNQVINFLGCSIQPKRCVPSAASTERIRRAVTEAISESKAAIKEALGKPEQLKPRLSRTATIDAIGKKIYGWQKAFSFCTDEKPFAQLDDFIAEKIIEYEAVVHRLTNGASIETRMMVTGMPSMREMFQGNPKSLTTKGASN
jgi:RNA-directed DNA polymerase